MKYILVIATLFLGSTCLAQKGAQSYAASATGSIYIPTIQSINIELLQPETIQFTSAEEYDQGKLIPGFIRATIVSNVPYLVSVMAGSTEFSSTAIDAPPMPVSVISLRDNITNQLTSLSASSKPLLINQTNQLKSVCLIDAHFHPGWTYSGGQYNTTLIFTLTTQ